MEENYSKFPTLSEANRAIKNLKSVDWPKFDESENIEAYIAKVESIFFQEFKVLPNMLKLFESKSFPLSFYRVREFSTFTNINLFTEHQYPPINLTKFGRCNFPKFPVFYCSNNPMTAIAEVAREGNFKGKDFCISSWRIIPSPNQFVFQSFLHAKTSNRNHFRQLSKAEIERINEPFQGKLTESQVKGTTKLLKYLQSVFLEDNDYNISATLAHRTLYVDHEYSCDILMYPSIQTNYDGVNMAINPNFVDKNFFLHRLYIIEVNEYNQKSGKFNVEIKKYGVTNRNRIIWKNINPNDTKYKEFMLEDFGGMMSKKEKGKFNFIKTESEIFNRKTGT